MKSSFQDNLQALREASVNASLLGLSENQVKIREPHHNIPQEVAINCLESLLTCDQDGTGADQTADRFIRQFTEHALSMFQRSVSHPNLNLMGA